MIKEIYTYLCSPRNYLEGVMLYQKYGVNRMYKKRFLEESEFNKTLLFEELRKLAGLSESEFANLPRQAKTSTVAAVSEPAEDEIEKNIELAPEPVQNMIRFRETYAFLNEPDCPDILKVLVSDMFTAYARYKEAFAQLQQLESDETIAATEACKQVVESYLENREIREELDYYKETGQILGKSSKFAEMKVTEELTELSDLELVKKLQSAQSNLSKNNKRLADAKAKGETDEKAEELVEQWRVKKLAIEAELEARKKK